MKPSDDQHIQALLKSSLVLSGRVELERDLWPEMLKRIESYESRPNTFGRWDWIAAGIVAICVVSYPALIPGLLYHL